MTSPARARFGLHPSMVLGAYLEALIRGRRVAVLGDATSGLGQELSQRGARLVHVYDPSAARTAEALARAAAVEPSFGGGGSLRSMAPSVTYALWAEDLGVRDGAFEVVMISDLSLFPDLSDVIRRVRRLTAATGVAVVISPNPSVSRALVRTDDAPGLQPPGYYALFDLVSLQFPVVRMLGQAPFVGYTLADFAAGPDLNVSVDTSMLDVTEEPEWFVALGSERPVFVDPFVVVELPFTEVAEALRVPATGSKAKTGDPLALADAQAQIATLSAELEKLRQRRSDETRTAETREAQVARASSRVVELEGQVEATGQRFKEAELRAGDAHVRAERLTHQIRDMDEELRHQRDRATRLSKQLDDEKKARTRAEVELGLAKGRPEVPGAKERVEALSAELEQARARIGELETSRSEQVAGQAPAPRVAELEASLKAIRADLKDAVIARDAAIDQADKASAELSEQRRGAELLAQARQALQDRLDEALADSGHARQLQAAADVAQLEAILQERGHVIAALKRDLHESERVGRELLEQLQARSSPAKQAGPPAESDQTQMLKGQLDVVSQAAARAQADLQAATWRIAQLERELEDTRSGRQEPAQDNDVLEQALVAAQQEIALLRDALEADPGVALRNVVEQSVLLHQIARSPGGDASTDS